MTGHLIVTDEDSTRVITLRRPEKKNALTQEMYLAMSEAIDSAHTGAVTMEQVEAYAASRRGRRAAGG